MDNQCHSSLLPPPSPLITVCVCPVGARPSEGLWAKSGEPYPTAPSSLASLFSVPVPGACWEREQNGVSEGWGGGRRPRRLAQPPTEGVPGWPDSRSVIVHFLLGCGSFLGPLCHRSFPCSSPSSSPSSFPPPPLFLGQVDQSSWKQAGLQPPCFSHLPPNPQLTLGPGRMKAPTPTTQHGSEG